MNASIERISGSFCAYSPCHTWPGQACGYKVGQTEILAQRERAKAALGAKYDLRDFNQAVVDGGNVPLDVLAGEVTRYIASA